MYYAYYSELSNKSWVEINVELGLFYLDRWNNVEKENFLKKNKK